MAGEDAVFTAAVARDEVRKSLARMEYHLNRGRKGERGWLRERDFLNALGRQSSKLGGGAGTAIGGAPGLGERALRAMQIQNANGAPSAATGKLKSSILGDFSADTMNGAREWTYDGQQEWIWTANASACPACLDNHGKRFTGPFVPMHPSCLCFPQQPVDAAAQGVRPLDTRQVVGTLANSNNPQFRAVGNQIRAGVTTTKEAASKAARQSSGDLADWGRALDKQAIRAADGPRDLPQPPTGARSAPSERGGTTPTQAPEPPQTPTQPVLEEVVEEPATILDVPEFVGIPSDEATQAYLAAKQVDPGAPITWVSNMEAAGVRIKHKAKRYADTIRKAEENIDAVVDSPGFRRELNEALTNMSRFDTLNNGKSEWQGRFHSVRGGGPTRMELQMRGISGVETAEFNVKAIQYNQTKKELSEAWRAAQKKSGQFSPQADEALQALQAHERTAKDLLESIKPVDRPAAEIAEVYLHEAAHAVDEANGWALSTRAKADGIKDEFLRIAHSGADDASAHAYGAEIGANKQLGRETWAELARFYYYGPGTMAETRAVQAVSAAEWRAANPKLAKWFEDRLKEFDNK